MSIDDVVGPVADELGDLVAQLGRGVDVDLARRRRRSVAAVGLARRQGSGPRVLSPVPSRSAPARAAGSAPGFRSYQTTRPPARKESSQTASAQHLSVPLCHDSAGEPAAPGCATRAAAAVDRLGRRARARGPAAPTSRCCRARAAAHARLARLGARRRSARRSRARGVARPWRHQVEAAEAAHAGQHVVVATGTASGKSLAYQLPALDRDPRGPRAARRARRDGALPRARPRRSPRTSSPALGALGLDVRVTTHDGDSRREERDWARDHARVRPHQPRHAAPLAAARPRPLGAVPRGRCDYVVVDECHHYRGVFGAHVAQVLRRLRRVCARYGAAPDVRARLGHRRRARGARPAGSPGSTCWR